MSPALLPQGACPGVTTVLSLWRSPWGRRKLGQGTDRHRDESPCSERSRGVSPGGEQGSAFPRTSSKPQNEGQGGVDFLSLLLRGRSTHWPQQRGTRALPVLRAPGCIPSVFKWPLVKLHLTTLPFFCAMIFFVCAYFIQDFCLQVHEIKPSFSFSYCYLFIIIIKILLT